MSQIFSISELRKRLATLQNERLDNGQPRYLFRGENADYPTSTHSLGRLSPHRVAYGQAYTVCRYASTWFRDQFDVWIDRLHVIALLQHYGWPTTFLDFTDAYEVALYFALLGYWGRGPAVVYVLDLKELQRFKGGVFTVIAFEDLQVVPGYDKLNHRLTRQRGYLLNIGWPAVEQIDLHELTGAMGSGACPVTRLLYLPSPGDKASTGELLHRPADEVGRRLQGLVQAIADGIFREIPKGSLDSYLQARIETMFIDVAPNTGPTADA